MNRMNRSSTKPVEDPTTRLKRTLLNIKMLMYGLGFVLFVSIWGVIPREYYDVSIVITGLLIGLMLMCLKANQYLNTDYYYRFPEYREDPNHLKGLPKNLQLEIMNEKIQQLEGEINSLEIELKCLKYN